LKLKTLKKALYKVDFESFFIVKKSFLARFGKLFGKQFEKNYFFYFSKRIIKSSNKKIFITE